MGYRKCMLVLLLGAVLAGCNYFVDQTTLAANPWCDHPIRCFDYEEELAASVAPETDPCDNLYKHVCDNWDRNHPSLVHDSSQIHMLQFRITAFLMGALKQAPPASSPASVTKAVRGFQQCIKVFDDERDDLKVLLDVFKKFTLHWPSANFSSDFDTLDFLVGVSLEYGLSTPFSLTLVPYLKTDSRYGLLLTMNIPSTNDGFEDVTVIEQCISKVAPWARSQEVSTVAGSIVAGFQDFISLYYLLYPGPYVALEFRTLEQMTNGSYEYWTLEDWLRVVNKHLPKDRQIDKDEEVLVYMNSDTALGDVLRSNPTRHITLVQYAAWSIIVQLYGGVSKDLVECVPPHLPPRLKSAVNCLGLANKIAPYAVSRFLREGLQLSDAAKQTGLVWEGVRNATQKNVRAWFDTNTVDGASKHLSSLIPVIGEPEHLKSASALDDYYDHLPQFTQPFLQSWLNASQRHMDKYKRLLKEGPSVTVHREDINEDMIGANAQYLPLFHVMVIKTGLMLPPFTSVGVPNAIPYGAIGRMLGQELTRAFDPFFTNVTRTGEPMDWYTPNSTSNFVSRLMCVHGQVEEITRDALHATNSLREAFADTAGTEKARLAYETLPEKKGLLGYTPEQAFYVASCFSFCGSSPYFPYTYNYPANALRCNLPVSNQAQFAAAFRCGDQASLNPAYRCTFHA